MNGKNAYMKGLLRKRGFGNDGRSAEAEVLAAHFLDIETWHAGESLPEDARRQRQTLDRVVHQVVRELRPCQIVVKPSEHGRPARDHEEKEEARLAREKLVCWAIGAIERLRAPRRLICKLKHAGLFYPDWEDGQLVWRPDEAKELRRVHRGVSFRKLMIEFRLRVAAVAVRQRGKVPF